jgi:hypothetical protein
MVEASPVLLWDSYKAFFRSSVVGWAASVLYTVLMTTFLLQDPCVSFIHLIRKIIELRQFKN